MSPEDWVDVLSHLRTRVREAGLGEVDDLVASDFRATRGPREDAIKYVDLLASAMAERSVTGYHVALTSLRESIQTESGKPIEGIEVEIQDADFPMWQATRVDLSQMEEVAPPLLAALRQIQAILREERDGEVNA